ncbi:MAG: hypothetical protein QXR59_02640 [Candidatus Bathyarchaeia archaeon]
MPDKFEIWVLPPNLRTASEVVAESLKKVDFDILYLNIQRGLDHLIEDLALGAPYEQFIEEVKRLDILREPISSWERPLKPILLTIRGLKLRRPHLRFICYRSPELENLFVKKAERAAILTFRVNSTGRVDIEEWRRIIYEILDAGDSSIEDEARYIFETYSGIGGRRRAICISDFSGRHILSRIRDAGINATLRYTVLPYHFTPMEVLVREAARMLRRGTNISGERIIRLVRLHAEFIREYILTSVDYDEAYNRWVRDKRFKEYQDKKCSIIRNI